MYFSESSNIFVAVKGMRFCEQVRIQLFLLTFKHWNSLKLRICEAEDQRALITYPL